MATPAAWSNGAGLRTCYLVPTVFYSSLLAFDARAQVGNLACPVLCLWGDRYGDISPGQWPQILKAFGYARLPNLVFHSIPNSHHFMMLEQPRETLQAIQDFLSNL